ncbi:MAG TPA: recombination mediator RecR [Bdellovibrionota bacterium]|nr:recombination mediator RecR [Bdellovibrionota bacterium]
MPKPFNRFIEELSKLPGIGEKTASRLAFFILKQDKGLARNIAHSLIEMREKIFFCSECFALTEKSFCHICSNPQRDRASLCIVETPQDLAAIEKSRSFKGLYHILHGRLSPLEGITPKDLKIAELIKRLEKNLFKEIIIATNANMEGETTAIYLTKLIKPLGMRVTHLAQGIPMGADLEYIDEVTIGKALANRIEL